MCSNVGAGEPQNLPRRASAHPAKRGPRQVPNGRPAGPGGQQVSPFPSQLRVPRALSKLARSEPRPRGASAPSYSSTARPCVPGVPACQRRPGPGWSGGYAPQPAGTSQVGARTRGGGEAGAGASKPRPFPRLGFGSAGRRGSRRRRSHRGGGSGSRPDPGSPALPSGSWLAGTTACSSASSPRSSSAPRGRSRSPIRTLCCWRCTRRGTRRTRR